MTKIAQITATLILCLTAYPHHAQSAPEEVAKEVESPKFDEALKVANQLFKDDKLKEAEAAYRTLRGQKTKLSTWGVASFNLALNLRAQKKFDESIQVLREILDSKLNDKDPGSNIMENYQNYHYKACLEISYTYEVKRNFAKALEYMELARSKYKYVSHCPTCAENAQKDWDAQVNAIKSAMKITPQ